MDKRFNRKKFRTPARAAKPRGLTIYYFGEGKGKTTAAAGLAVRARGAGLRVAFLQFMKTERWPSFERQALRKLGVHVDVLGTGFVGIVDDTKKFSEHRQAARRALAHTRRTLHSGRFAVVVADEVVSALDEKLLTVSEVLSLVRARPPKVHLVLTGHSRYPALVRVSDLVTEMRNVKHPYKTLGMPALRGIDF